MQLDAEQEQFSNVIVEKSGQLPIKVHATGPLTKDHLAFASFGNGLISVSGWPEDGEQLDKGKFYVWPVDPCDQSRVAPPINSMCYVQNDPSRSAGSASVILVAETRIILAHVKTNSVPVPRHILVNGDPLRLIFSKAWNCLIVAAKEAGGLSLQFLDADTGEQLARPIMKTEKGKQAVSFLKYLGDPKDSITGLYEWILVKGSHTFAFIVVGTKLGKLFIVGVEPDEGETTAKGNERLIYYTRFRKQEDESKTNDIHKAKSKSIFAITSNGCTLMYNSGDNLRVEHLYLNEKKLKLAFKPYCLDSVAMRLRVEGNKLFVLTLKSSLHVLRIPEYDPDNMPAEPTKSLSLLHEDDRSQTAFDMIDIGSTELTNERGQFPIHMVSSTDGGLTGLSVPRYPQERSLDTVFSGRLQCSIRRFVRAHSSPGWLGSAKERKYGTLPLGQPDCAIFGIALNGAMYHFTLLDRPLLAFLHYVQHTILTRALPSQMPLTPEFGGKNRTYKRFNSRDVLDGDILRRSLDHHLLVDEIKTKQQLRKLCQLLDDLEGGKHTAAFNIDKMDTDSNNEASSAKATNAKSKVLSSPQTNSSDDGDALSQEEKDDAEGYFKLARAILIYLLTPSIKPNFPAHGAYAPY